MTSSNFMYCGDDEEILSALYAADNFASELNSFKSTKSGQNLSVPDSGMSSWNSNSTKFQLNEMTIKDDCISIQELDKVEIDAYHEDPVYQELLQSIHSIQVMCDLCIEKSRNIKVEFDEVMKPNLDSSKQVMSTQILSENLEKITTAFEHMSSIAKQCSHLKQVLRNGLSQKGLTVNPSSQKSVIKFFKLAKIMIDNFTEDRKNIEACLTSTSNLQQYNVQIQLQINEHLKNVARRIDNMVELRSILGDLQPDIASKEMKNPISGAETSLNSGTLVQPNLHSLDSDLLLKL